MSRERNSENLFEGQLESLNRTKISEPRLYRVILHNDHYTTMEFVVDVLIQVFHKTAAEATGIMLDVHKKGQGVCGVYMHDIAATKVSQVLHLARGQAFPLKCILEEI